MAQESVQGGTASLQAEVAQLDDFTALLQKEFKPADDIRKNRIEESVKTLAHQALENASIIGEDVYATVDALRAELDRKLTEQVNQIIHNEEFQALESAWRGLHYMVMNTSTGKDMKIRVMNMSKEECRKMFRQYRDAAWDQSPLFKKVYESEFGQLGGQPYGAFVCDYYFDHTAPNLEVMKGLAKIGAAAHAPFIAAAAPPLFGMESWTELSNPRDLGKLFDAQEYSAWRTFRASEDSRYLSLTMPRFWAARSMAPRPSRSTSSISKRKPAASTIITSGSTPPMRWARASPMRSTPMAGARAFAAWNRAARWKVCRPQPSRPTRAVWITNAPPKSRFPTVARPSCRPRA
jgi:type VI secretion system protein ImpC